jgi:putative glycosyltransferase (TIGR04372 family)
MTNQYSQAEAYERKRLRAKKRGLPRSLRGLALLVAVMPLIALVKLLTHLGLDMIKYPDQFGHQAIDVEYFLRTKSRGRFRPVFLRSRHVANAFLLHKHCKHVHVLPLPPAVMRLVNLAEKLHIQTWGAPLFRTAALDYVLQDGDTWTSSAPTIVFTDEEQRVGRAILSQLGLEPQHYVCFHSRQAAYARKSNADLFAQRGAAANATSRVVQFEESLFQTFRNSDFSDYGPAIAGLARHGLKAVRIGAIVEGDVGEMPNLVDYAGQHRAALGEEASFADVWLMANARFYVGTSSGVTASAYIFNLPIVWVNSFPWPWGHAPAREGSLYLPKLVSVGGRVLKLTELIGFSRTHDWRVLYDDAAVKRLGWLVIDNSPEEIAAVVEEMELRLSGAVVDKVEDEALHLRLQSHFDPRMPMYYGRGRMGRDFLSTHQNLLEEPDARDAVSAK